jgi:hypothetical protein
MLNNYKFSFIFILLEISYIFSGCSLKRDNIYDIKNPNIPTADKIQVTTLIANNITSNSAVVSGKKSPSSSNSKVTSMGVCYDRILNPDITKSVVYSSINKDTFSCSLSGLDSNITYHYRAFAIIDSVVKYGADLVFTTFTKSSSFTVGCNYGGGKIAYIIQQGDPGYVSGEVHGLIAAINDQSIGMRWGCIGTETGGSSTALGTGAANTAIISAACGSGFAAKLCDDLVLNGYKDWYLPSLDELNKLYINRKYIGLFGSGIYWSSSEFFAYYAWAFYFSSGIASFDVKGSTYYVRAIRSF